MHRTSRGSCMALLETPGLAAILASCTRTAPQEASAQAGVGSATRVIQNKGRATMVNRALSWAEAYRQAHPDADIVITGIGIAALINGAVDIANASREMNESEIEAARANGVEPVEHLIAIDAPAVIVNPANPVRQWTIAAAKRLSRH